MTIVFLILAIFFLSLNYFFVFAEFAVVRSRSSVLNIMIKKGDKRAKVARRILSRLDAFLTLSQLGITISSLGLGWVMEPAFSFYLEKLLGITGLNPVTSHIISMTLVFLFVTVIHMVFGELVPRFIAIRNADRNLIRIAYSLYACYYILYPLLMALDSMTYAILRFVGVDPGKDPEHSHTEEELRQVIARSYEKGKMDISKLLLLENVFELSERTVQQMMIKLEDVVFLDPSDGWDINQRKIEVHKHSRYPLLGEGANHFYVHVKDILYEQSKGSEIDLGKLSRNLMTVKTSWKLEKLLRCFHDTKNHFAMVVDDSERPVGIVTFEDLVEEIVGPIYDEFDPVKEFSMYKLVGNNISIHDPRQSTVESALRNLIDSFGGKFDPDAVRKTLKNKRLSGTIDLNEYTILSYARIKMLYTPIALLGISNKPLKYENTHTTRIVMLLLTPLYDDRVHIGVLEKLTTLMQSDYLCERLIAAGGIESISAILKEIDKGISA